MSQQPMLVLQHVILHSTKLGYRIQRRFDPLVHTIKPGSGPT
jgi:hypothetical protein